GIKYDLPLRIIKTVPLKCAACNFANSGLASGESTGCINY
ncbi:hypothetical protein AAULR_15063, partial [Lacticaseibacillus rhamnosus MTCC 5462]